MSEMTYESTYEIDLAGFDSDAEALAWAQGAQAWLNHAESNVVSARAERVTLRVRATVADLDAFERELLEGDMAVTRYSARAGRLEARA